MSQAELSDLANPAAGAPTRVVAVSGDTRATLTWLPHATHTHTIKRSTTSGGPYTTIAEGVTDLSYTDDGLTNGVTYYYVVSGTNGQGAGPDSAEATVTPSTLGLHLRFDESSGTIAADSSGRARHATLINDPNFGAGRINNGLNLTSTSSQYATLPSGIVSGVTDFTVSTWVKVDSFATWQRIFDFGTGTNNHMFLTTQYTGSAPNAAKLRFGIRTPSVVEQSVSGSGIALTAGVWTHVAVVRSGAIVSLYVNGALAGSGTITLGPSDLGITTQNYLGKSQFNDPYLDAALDDFRLYSQAMSPAEITSLATPLAAPQNLTATPGPLSLDLSWDAVPDATSYTVMYSTVSGGPYLTLASGLAATSRTHSGLSQGTTYHYVVTAANAHHESPLSDEFPATPDPVGTAIEDWRLAHFGTTADSGDAADDADPDGDGWTNLQEFVSGTDPNDPASVLKVTRMQADGNDIELSFPTVEGKTYRLERSATLGVGSWTPVREDIPGTGAEVQVNDPGGAGHARRFYRVVVGP